MQKSISHSHHLRHCRRQLQLVSPPAKIAHRAAVQAEQMKIVHYQASQQGIALLSEEEIKSIVADSIGKEASSLTFRTLTLKVDDEDSHEKMKKI